MRGFFQGHSGAAEEIRLLPACRTRRARNRDGYYFFRSVGGAPFAADPLAAEVWADCVVSLWL